MSWLQWVLVGLGVWIVGSILIGLGLGRLFRMVEAPVEDPMITFFQRRDS